MGNLSLEAKKEIEKELDELSAIYNYLEKTNNQDASFNSIKRRDEVVLLDGIKIPKILMLENPDGVIEILERSKKTELSKEEIQRLSDDTKLKIEDIAQLIELGMTTDEISQAAKMIPFKENSQSEAIREMIKMNIDSNKLSGRSSGEIIVTSIDDDMIQIEKIDKIAEVDRNGLVKLDQNWLEKNESLRLYNEAGLIDLSQELVVQDLPKNEYENAGNGSLEIVPLSKKKEDKTKEEIEKVEIARELGENPDNILCVIEIEDRDGASKMFNYDISETSKPMIVRLRNNNFKILDEKQDGTRSEVKGFEVTPAAKYLASSLKDTNSLSLFTTLKAGEIRAGKTNSNQEKYDVFLIRRAGESKDDDSNNLLFVGFSGRTDMSLVENKDGGMEFQRVPISSVYPKSIYLEENDVSSHQEEKTIEAKPDKEKENNNEKISFNDIKARMLLLKKLKEIDRKIEQIENNIDNEEREEGDLSDEDKLTDLKLQRTEIIKKLNMKESKALEYEENNDRYLGDNINNYH